MTEVLGYLVYCGAIQRFVGSSNLIPMYEDEAQRLLDSLGRVGDCPGPHTVQRVVITKGSGT